eukprot:jgi/Picsp_1/1079/NSC_04562-R1_---NA---
MGPTPVRALTRKNASKLPSTQRIIFLQTIAMETAKKYPAYASYLGRRCLKEIDTNPQPFAVKNSQIANLCRRCGCPLQESEKKMVGKLSGTAIRRSLRRALKNKIESKDSLVMRAAVTRECVLCGHKMVAKYPDMSTARQRGHSMQSVTSPNTMKKL